MKNPKISRSSWTIEEQVARMGYEFTPLELELANHYARARIIEYEGYSPAETYSGKELEHLHYCIIQVMTTRVDRKMRDMLRERG